MNNKLLNSYFFILFSLIPVSILFGSTISLINILLIDFSFIFLILYKKNYKFWSDRTIKLILFLCLYLVFNSIISKDFEIGAARNFGFIRLGILFLAFNYFFYNKNFFNKVLIVWTIILSIVIIDVYIESIFKRNMLGYSMADSGRLVSFFKDEPIVGGYLNGFYLIIIGYLFCLNNKFLHKYKNYILIFSIIFFIGILLTGERSNSIKAFLGFLIFYFYNDYFKLKQKFLFIFLIFLIIGFLLNQISFLKSRYAGQIIVPIMSIFLSDEENIRRGIEPNLFKLKDNNYIKLYSSGIAVFKNYPIFGIGNKNYRVATCALLQPLPKQENNAKYFCSTHPHQIYFELLAEHGVIGVIILFFILFNLIFSKITVILASKNYIQIGSLVFLSVTFIPLLPSGAFFSDFNLTIFWINLSIMYSASRKTNVFTSN
tara:strand:- start:61 stop:1350 length:1290 start_codon:yes stop_codon:yes gene_type:complete